MAASFFKRLAVLKLIVDFSTQLIGAEGTNPAKMLTHFLTTRCSFGEAYSMSCGRSVSAGDPAVANAPRSVGPPANA